MGMGRFPVTNVSVSSSAMDMAGWGAARPTPIPGLAPTVSLFAAGYSRVQLIWALGNQPYPTRLLHIAESTRHPANEGVVPISRAQQESQRGG